MEVFITILIVYLITVFAALFSLGMESYDLGWNAKHVIGASILWPFFVIKFIGKSFVPAVAGGSGYFYRGLLWCLHAPVYMGQSLATGFRMLREM